MNVENDRSSAVCHATYFNICFFHNIIFYQKVVDIIFFLFLKGTIQAFIRCCKLLLGAVFGIFQFLMLKNRYSYYMNTLMAMAQQTQVRSVSLCALFSILDF